MQKYKPRYFILYFLCEENYTPEKFPSDGCKGNLKKKWVLTEATNKVYFSEYFKRIIKLLIMLSLKIMLKRV